MLGPELLIKNIISEILFGIRICESEEDHYVVQYIYNKLYESRFLIGEPITVPELRKLLHNKIVNFEFIKLNNEIRPARGTTMLKYVPTDQHPKGIRPSSPTVATFYDLDKRDWRSVSQRSKEIVLKKDKESGKPVVMVKDKPEGDVAVKTEEPIAAINGKPVEEPVEKPKVTKVKPVEKTEGEERFYFINPVTGASLIMDLTPKDTIKKLKELGQNWRLTTEEEFNEYEEQIDKVSQEEPEEKEIEETPDKQETKPNLEDINKEDLETLRAEEIE